MTFLSTIGIILTIFTMGLRCHAVLDDGSALLQLLPESQHAAANFLLANMPDAHRQTLTPEFLAQHIDYAYRARESFPWTKAVPEDIFFNNVLPYSSLDEQLDSWRQPFFERFGKLVDDCQSAGEAAIKLNTTIFDKLNVRYSRQRSKACMSPFEVMEEGKASCTGLSILLVSVCRAVGIPARVVGTPDWVEGGGNHTWVEIWDEGWHSIGASESKALNKTWFAKRASQQIADNSRHAIYAVSFAQTDTPFPLVWARRNQSVSAVNVTHAYTTSETAPVEADTIADVLAQQSLAELLAKLQQDDMLIQPDDLGSITDQVWQKYVHEITNSTQRLTEQAEKAITYDGKTMRYTYEVVGKKPDAGYPLYIALHGGGGAPAHVNDSQWKHMQAYYLASVTNGIYIAPRGVNNEWNLHWRKQSFVCYDRLIENMIAFGLVDPNRVYLVGFSAGGDALYQIPARMADRWAAAAMSAGHPNGVAPDNYANLAFLIQVGARDAAYKRNQVGAEYGVKLGNLQAAHPGLYRHATYIHAGRGHNFLDHGPADLLQRVFADPATWLKQGTKTPTEDVDANAIRWLDRHARNPLPRKLIWDVKTHATRSGEKQPGFWPTTEKANLHYWIGIDRYDKDIPIEAERIVVERAPDTQQINVHEIGNFVRFYLHPAMFKPGQQVTVHVQGRTLQATPKPSLRTLLQTVLDRGDPHYIFPATLTLSLNPEGNWMLE